MSENPAYAFDMVPSVTAEQLERAVASAFAAVTLDNAPATANSLGTGPYGAMNGEAAARMAAAISHAFPAFGPPDELLLKGLIWRGIFAFSDVVSDARFAAFGHSSPQQFTVGRALLAAVAATPMPFGGDVPVDAIFGAASDAITLDGHLSEMMTIAAPRARQ